MKNLWFAFFFWSASFAQAQAVSIPAESFTELADFETSAGRRLSENYVREFPVRVHQDIVNRKTAFASSLNGTCKSFFKVTFAPKIFSAPNTPEAEFEDGLIRIEASYCYKNADPSDLISISADSRFKKRAFSTLTNIRSEGAEDCEWTSAPTIGKSHYCYRNLNLEKAPDIWTQISFLTYNDKDTNAFDAPVYFREALVSAKRMGPETLYYVVSYVRATQISSFKRLFAEGYINQSQNQVFKELESTLRQKRGLP